MDTIYYDGFSGLIEPAASAVIANYTVVDMFASVATGNATPEAAAKAAARQAERDDKLIRSRRSARQGVGRFTSLPRPEPLSAGRRPSRPHGFGRATGGSIHDHQHHPPGFPRFGGRSLGYVSALAQDAPDTDVPMADVKPPEFQIEKGAELPTPSGQRSLWTLISSGGIAIPKSSRIRRASPFRSTTSVGRICGRRRR